MGDMQLRVFFCVERGGMSVSPDTCVAGVAFLSRRIGLGDACLCAAATQTCTHDAFVSTPPSLHSLSQKEKIYIYKPEKEIILANGANSWNSWKVREHRDGLITWRNMFVQSSR